MNLVRSSIVPQTMARAMAQKTNSKKNFADDGTSEPLRAGRFIVEPGRKEGANPEPPPMMWPRKPLPAPKARAKPTAQYRIELMERLTMIFATTVPTFFIREKQKEIRWYRRGLGMLRGREATA